MPYMLSSIFSPFQNKGGDEWVGSVATAAIAALFKTTDSLNAKVRANPVSKILQGSLDGFDLVGRGLEMRNGLRVARMDLRVQAVAIDLSSLMGGKIKLRQPTSGTLSVVLSEKDLSRSFNTPFIVEKLQLLTFEGEPLNFSNTGVELQDGGIMLLYSQISVGKETEPLDVRLRTKITLEEDRRILFSDPIIEGSERSQAVAIAILDHINSLMDLDKFKLDGVALRMHRCDIRRGQLTLDGSAKIRHFPGMGA
jgi:LmeA-like phospholipid-binding